MIVEKTDKICDGMLLVDKWTGGVELVIGLNVDDCQEKLTTLQNQVSKGLLRAKRNSLQGIRTLVLPITNMVLDDTGTINCLPSSLSYLSECIQYRFQKLADIKVYHNLVENIDNIDNSFSGYRVNAEFFNLNLIKYRMLKPFSSIGVEDYINRYNSILSGSSEIAGLQTIATKLSIRENLIEHKGAFVKNEIYFSLTDTKLTATQYLGNDTWLNLGCVYFRKKDTLQISNNFLDINYHMRRKEIRQYTPKIKLYSTILDLRRIVC